MRPGRTSAVVFASKIVITAVGFLATLYFARVIGSYNLGTYFLLLSVMSMLSILIQAGIGGSIVKRMSEGDKPASYFVVGGGIIAGALTLLSLILIALANVVNRYIDNEFGTVFLVALLGANAAMALVRAGLRGSHNVHLTGVANSLQAILRVGLQVLAVSLGFSLVGLVFGWVTGTAIVALLGLLFLGFTLKGISPPDKDEINRRIRSMFAYSKYSWLGAVKAQTHNYADIVILGLFVSNGFIGVYAVCWNIASFLSIFGAAVHETLFPELSRLATDGDIKQTTRLVTQSIQYSGMFVIPGLVGGGILGNRILGLYGSEFRIGTTVLIVLIAAILFYDYQKQFTNALNGMDLPELAFNINAVFIVSNILLNLLLISLIGWSGAAFATMMSAAISLVYAHESTASLIDIDVPVGEIANQTLSALVMAIVVLVLSRRGTLSSLVENQFVVVGGLVFVGVVVYLGLLLSLSASTRRTVFSNLGLG